MTERVKIPFRHRLGIEPMIWKGRSLEAIGPPETHLIYYHRALGTQRRRLGTRFMGRLGQPLALYGLLRRPSHELVGTAEWGEVRNGVAFHAPQNSARIKTVQPQTEKPLKG
jgi:hypothetical protein